VHYQPRPISAPVSLDSIESRTLDNPDLGIFLRTNQHISAWPPKRWDVQALSLVGFYYNPDLDVARADWAVARAAGVTAGERPNPNASVAPAFNSTTPASQVRPWILSLDLDFTIETAGKRGHRIAQARQLSRAAQLAIASAAWQVRSRVRQSLLSLFEAGETAALLETQQKLQSTVVELLDRQLAAGAISPFELTRARIALDTIRLASHDAARQHAEARGQLADALGINVHALDGAEFDFGLFRPLPKDLPAPDVRRQALLNRPDILGALETYGASQSALQFEIARQYPDIHLGPGYQLDQTDNKWTLGLSGALPLFNRNRGPIAEAEARRTQAAARFTAVQAHTIGEIDVALATYRAALEKVTTAETLVAQSEKQERLTKASFDAGDLSRLDMSVIQLQLAVIQLARLDALVKAHQALGRLEDAIQRPTDLTEWASTVMPRDPGQVRQ
jgi:outer membrane protein TolC